MGGQLARGDYVDPSAGQITFGAYVAEYVELQVWRSRTRKANDVALARALERWRDRPMGSIKTSDARNLVAHLGARLAASTLRVNVTAISSVFR